MSAWDYAAKAWPKVQEVDQEFVGLLVGLARRVEALERVPEPELQRMLSHILAREPETSLEIDANGSFDLDSELDRYLDLCASHLAATAEEARVVELPGGSAVCDQHVTSPASPQVNGTRRTAGRTAHHTSDSSESGLPDRYRGPSW